MSLLQICKVLRYESDGLKNDAALLFELCFKRDGDFCLPGFSSQEISQMIHCILYFICACPLYYLFVYLC